MDNPDINNKKLSLIKQIYEYNNRGYNLNKHYSISDDINELKYQLALLQHNYTINKKLKLFELLFMMGYLA